MKNENMKNIERFIEIQKKEFNIALGEIKNGYK